MKIVISILVLVFIIFCGCTQTTPVVETTPTPVTVVPTFLTQTPTETVGPTPTQNYDVCFDKNITIPDYCYDHYYWVRPVVTPVGMGYTARVWKNDSCVYRNRTSEESEEWGDDSWTATFMKNLTVVRNITGVNLSEVIAATSYYIDTWELNTVNGADFNSFIKAYWNGIYPATPYDKSLFAPDPNVSVVVVSATFDPKAW
jgi:hypothetical protein